MMSRMFKENEPKIKSEEGDKDISSTDTAASELLVFTTNQSVEMAVMVHCTVTFL